VISAVEELPGVQNLRSEDIIAVYVPFSPRSDTKDIRQLRLSLTVSWGQQEQGRVL